VTVADANAPANTVLSVERAQAYSGPFFAPWVTFSQNFIANSDSTLLTFINTRGASNAGIYLDDVSVERVAPVAVPGPVVGAGLPGIIAALGGLIAFARRRRQQAV
jgi:hypothetical protein